MEYQYLLFDLDGTLTDSMEGITTSVQYALKAFGIEEPNLEKLTPFIGPPLKESFMQYYDLDEIQAEEAVVKYREWFVPKGIYQNKIYSGIEDMLKELKDGKKVLAVASSKPIGFVRDILNYFHIISYFDVIVGSELDGSRGTKEEVVEEALRQLGVCEEKISDKQRTVMIGDRKYDILGGKEHGLVTVGVSYGYAAENELEKAGADYIVDTVQELKELLQR